MFKDHIAKLPNLIVLCITPIWLNGKRPVSLCVDIDSVAAALTHQFETQSAQQRFEIPKRDRSATFLDLFKGFCTPSHTDRYYDQPTFEHQLKVVHPYRLNFSSL